ncbi:hypothetical protein NQ318_011228 [Aromia moschata]|uniref:Uncharacterized protein n=1 Tax=Aromia moschata TaxID=1265417 RepID=A0AAV8YJA8_9CUCU|nr:hypothetical protein NQ318_011228 [Aromia moschata]
MKEFRILKQCAAVKIYLLEIRDPPHVLELSFANLATTATKQEEEEIFLVEFDITFCWKHYPKDNKGKIYISTDLNIQIDILPLRVITTVQRENTHGKDVGHTTKPCVRWQLQQAGFEPARIIAWNANLVGETHVEKSVVVRCFAENVQFFVSTPKVPVPTPELIAGLHKECNTERPLAALQLTISIGAVRADVRLICPLSHVLAAFLRGDDAQVDPLEGGRDRRARVGSVAPSCQVARGAREGSRVHRRERDRPDDGGLGHRLLKVDECDVVEQRLRVPTRVEDDRAAGHNDLGLFALEDARLLEADRYETITPNDFGLLSSSLLDSSTYVSTQWAAVKAQVGAMKEAPQKPTPSGRTAAM